MKVREIRDEAELHMLRPAWEALLRDATPHSIFATWEWTMAWWSAYGEPGAMRILAAENDRGVLRGIVPLRAEPAQRYRRSVPSLRFLADGSNDSDYLDCIVSAPFEQEAREAFQGYWSEQLSRGTVLRLNEIPENSGTVASLRNVTVAGKTLFCESAVPCATVHLPASWEGYLAMLKPRFRTKVRSVLRNLESRPEVRFGFCATAEEVQSLLPVLFDLHTRRWLQDGKPGVFGWDRKREFYAHLSRLLLERGWLRFTWLKWKEQVLACQYGFIYHGAYSQLQEGYEPAAEHWNPGVGVRAWSIREFIQTGVREYDFLGGVGRHKTDWGAAVKHSTNLLVANDTWKNRIFVNGPEWEERIKKVITENVPEKVLTVARKGLSRGDVSDSNKGRNGAEQTGLMSFREATANCYYYFQVPRLVRPLRNRYQLTLKSADKRRHVSWRRRAEAGVRILYYHRVNNDNDPFFHAISTTLFEQQMRYIARFYKVLSLADALKHLESDSTETVLAVTFDDGYQDNYVNAFPILQRYGLPATIFLTTGTMDSGEPLWFERLALALKTTNREFIDLEVAIPRRLPLVTVADRLAANDQIFTLLRGLPDSDRRYWLALILRELGSANDDARRRKLLTWDQVRFMKLNGIDFGGHTVTHPFISRLTSEDVMAEVSGCKRRIEEELQLPVHHFAYPNGREEDFGLWNKDCIRAAGYRAAVTTIWGINDRSTDPMELRRGGPWETTLPLFAYKLDWYQLVND